MQTIKGINIIIKKEKCSIDVSTQFPYKTNRSIQSAPKTMCYTQSFTFISLVVLVMLPMPRDIFFFFLLQISISASDESQAKKIDAVYVAIQPKYIAIATFSLLPSSTLLRLPSLQQKRKCILR